MLLNPLRREENFFLWNPGCRKTGDGPVVTMAALASLAKIKRPMRSLSSSCTQRAASSHSEQRGRQGPQPKAQRTPSILQPSPAASFHSFMPPLADRSGRTFAPQPLALPPLFRKVRCPQTNEEAEAGLGGTTPSD